MRQSTHGGYAGSVPLCLLITLVVLMVAAPRDGALAADRPAAPVTTLTYLKGEYDVSVLPALVRRPSAAEAAQMEEGLVKYQAAYDSNDWEGAERLARQVMEIETRTYGPAHPMFAISLRRIGFSNQKRGRFAEAERLFRQAIAIDEAYFGRGHFATSSDYSYLANVFFEQGRYPEGVAPARTSLEVIKTAGRPVEETFGPITILAVGLAGSGKGFEAEALLKGMLEATKAGGNDHGTMKFLANVLRSQGRLDEAQVYLVQSLEALRRAPDADPEKLADGYYACGSNLMEMENYAAARPYLQTAVTLYRRLGEDSPKTLAAYERLASTVASLGYTSEADQLYDTATQVRRRTPAKDDAGAVDANRALAARLSAEGRYAEAQPLLEAALQINRRLLGDAHSLVARDMSSVADNLSFLGRLTEAQPLYERALDIVGHSWGEQSPYYGDAAFNLGSNLFSLKRYEEARAPAATALSIARKTGIENPSRLMNALLLNVLTYSVKPADRPQAVAMAREAVEIARVQQRQASGAEDGAGNRPSQEAEAARTNSLKIAFGTFIEIASVRGNDAPAEAQALLAEAFLAAQDLDRSSAGAALAQAGARVAAGREGLAETVRRQQDLATQARSYERQFLQAVARRDESGAAAMQAALAQIAPQLKTLDDEIGARFPQYAELISPRALDVEAVRQRLTPGEGVLLITGSRSQLYVFAISKAGFQARLLAGKATDVAAAVAVLRCQVDPATCGQTGTGGTRAGSGPGGASVSAGFKSYDRAKAYGLYRDLIAPVEGALEGVKTLYVTAAGPLSALPLGLLISEAPKPGDDADPGVLAGSSWLADKYALISLPSVSSLRALGALKTTPARLALSGYGDPVLEGRTGGDGEVARGAGQIFRGVTTDSQPIADTAALRTSLAALPGTGTELKAIARALGASVSSLRLGEAATETAVKTSTDLPQARVVIFATHGLLPHDLKDLQEPGLVFTPPVTGSMEDDGVLTASEAARLKLSADWVILSACNTASADGTPGAESLSGLAKAFLYAGANALLASHWRVQDDVTAVLTVRTISIARTNPGRSKAQALQAAMKAVRTGFLPNGDRLPGWNPTWSHPTAWAPFALIAAGE